MVSTIFLLLGAAISYCIFNIVSGLRNNIAAAKRSGLPYYVVPLSPWNRIGQILNGVWVPMYKLLPRQFWEQVEPILYTNWQYEENHKLFAKLGDTFLIVSPGMVVCYTENAEVLHQVTSKREAFPKPTEAYAILGQYGQNVLTLEGAAWRMHRKITSASFNEKNAALVFKESISQTEGLMNMWLGSDGLGNKTINTLERDTASLTLNIIANIGFGLKILWPGQKFPADADPRLAKYATQDAPEGHTMTFVKALAHTLDYLILLLITPKWILKNFPSKTAKLAVEAESNLVGYLNEFLQDKIEDVRNGDYMEQGLDIMGALVRTSYGESPKNGSQIARLSDSEIIGNAFINIVAGHETTANILHFAMIELATNPASQRRLQRDIDNILGDTDPKAWDYDAKLNPLLGSMVGAAINETLRLVPPVVDIPKKITSAQGQSLTIGGTQHPLPQNTTIGLVVVASQRSPKYWPNKPSRINNAETDLDDFVPERWFQTESAKDSSTAVEGADTEDFGGYAGSDTSAQLYHPPRGSFIPFSDGARACLGRRMAIVELVATLAVIFQKYSIELAVDEWANDDKVSNMSKDQKAKLYKTAQRKSRETVKLATSVITLKLHGNKYVPIRLVKRGDERFVNWVDL
ncbi:cytochrome P450 [Annulohypoxylon maeteangense]|uniref:cytochrome P450 n=1 Tax=Annulohypoxylon maeteangense TaxID=1927788 RepID=UPI002007A211|nr:cytochrome P450 [Annulohypoxylon maeteangense]KAI0885471.1 cytochrome P450 [Annulohypoxylon maeteangense]